VARHLPAGEVKVGGHQASSASLVSVMTALFLAHLEPGDRVAVKPHAAPVLHALNYLLGDLDAHFLRSLRSLEGLQAYPSRTKDPDRVDFSTGSVGLGAAAPLFAAVTRRYVDARFGPRPPSRFVSLIGDAELDEGNVWEAVADPATQGLGNVMWVIDFNRQSLDRVVPGIRIDQWRGQFESAGWHVVEVKYGRQARNLFGRPGGDALRRWIDSMQNEQYQSLFGLDEVAVRSRLLDGASEEACDFVALLTDEELRSVTDLGGHDLAALLEAFAECDSVVDRPSVVFAYTVKGSGLPIAGNPRNHSAMLTETQIASLRVVQGLTTDDEWSKFADDTPEGQLCRARGDLLRLSPRRRSTDVTVPNSTLRKPPRTSSTQETFGRVLTDLSRDDSLRPLLVTTAPDVATSTNLAGFINRTGVYSPEPSRAWSPDPALRWTEGPGGQHIELGISEMNLFLLLGQLGLAWDLSEQPLLAIGTVYDPFVLRGLDAFIHATYSGSRFVVAGTPSGITLAPEGGAHQSTITASVGLEMPGVTLIEPTYAMALDWLLCDALHSIASDGKGCDGPSRAETTAYYFRLTTRPLDQAPHAAALARLGEAVLRRSVLEGCYRLIDAHQAFPELDEHRRNGVGVPEVTIATSGPVVTEALSAAQDLAEEGIAAHVVDVTSLDRLHSAWMTSLRLASAEGRTPSLPGALRRAFAVGAPVVTVHDASPHTMSWLGSALGVPCIPLGVDGFGQSGTVQDLYRTYGIDRHAVVAACFSALQLRRSHTSEGVP